MTLDNLREEWIGQRPRYETFARHIQEILTRDLQKHCIRGIVTSRAKEIDSLVKKAIVGGYNLDQISDKAGARIVLTYPDQVSQADSLIAELLMVHERDDKAEKLGESQLGYLGIHYAVSLRPDQAGEYTDLRCEVQLHTRAQNLWSDTAHDLAYKPASPLPTKIGRAIYRLIALIELFDDQIANARAAILKQPGFREALILELLEKHYYRLTAKLYRRELSLHILGCLAALIPEPALLAETTAAFVADKDEKLRFIYEQYRDDQRCSPLLFQPEALLIFPLLEHDRHRLKDTWDRVLAPELLEDLAAVWGVSL